jgi:hypothetical protein
MLDDATVVGGQLLAAPLVLCVVKAGRGDVTASK